MTEQDGGGSNSSGIARFVAGALDGAVPGDLPAVVVLAEERDPAQIRAILEQRSVAAVIVTPTVASRLGTSDRVGILGDDGEWRMPLTRGRSILMLSGGRLLNIKRSLRAWRAGVRVVFSVHNLNTLSRATLWRWIARRSAMLIGATMARLANGHLSRLIERRITRRLTQQIAQREAPVTDHYQGGSILLVNNSLAAGGAERQLVNTALALHEDGHCVSIRCRYLDTAEYDFYRDRVEPKVSVARIAGLLDIRARLAPAELEVLGTAMDQAGLARLAELLPVWIADDVIQLAANLLVDRPQVVHYWQDYTNVVGGLAAVLVGVPRVVLGMRNMAPHRFPYFDPFMAPIYKALAACPNVELVNNSAAGARDYAAWLGLDPSRIRVILNGVSGFSPADPDAVLAWRRGIDLAPGDPVVGSIFRFWPEKDPMLWVEAAAMVAQRHPRIRFLLVGDGPMRAEIVRRAQRLGIGDKLCMPGNVADPRLAIGSMDVFLMTSRIEGTPNVLIEAQHLGCPVVTTVAGGSAETVEHGRTGWVVAQRDAQALADRVVEVIEDEAWRSSATREAPPLAQARFGVGRMLSETKRAYGVA